jgi:predicted TIM-barrel fold metal-dependent hydrolase
MLVGGAFASVQTPLGSARANPADAQTGTGTGTALPAGGREPIIDVHMHAYPADDAIPATALNKITRRPPGVKDGRAHLQACLAEMKRLNIVKGVVSGGTGDRLAAAMHWQETAPDRFIAGAGVRGSADVPLPEVDVLRKAFAEGRIRVLGEVTAQYAGLSLSDPKYTPYLALAEEFDIPVAVHTGPGGGGISYDPCCRGYRASLGNPATLEEALNRHPKLRLNIMHGGWPYLEDTLAVLSTYPQVYLDLGYITWGQPRAEFHSYLGALVRAGFNKRLMFGSDQMYWPQAIGMAVDGIDSATFLTPAQKRDIFYNNAARFLKLEEVGDRKAL